MGGSTCQPALDKKIQHELKAKFYKHFTVSKAARNNNICFCNDHWRYENAVKDLVS